MFRVAQVCQRKKTSVLEAYAQLLPFLSLILLTACWLASPFSKAMVFYTIPLFLAVGILFARMAVLFF